MINKIITYLKETPYRMKFAWNNLKINHKAAWDLSGRLVGKNAKK